MAFRPPLKEVPDVLFEGYCADNGRAFARVATVKPERTGEATFGFRRRFLGRLGIGSRVLPSTSEVDALPGPARPSLLAGRGLLTRCFPPHRSLGITTAKPPCIPRRFDGKNK